MIETLTNNAFFGIIISVLFYLLAHLVYRKTRIPLLNPFLLSMTGLVVLLLALHIPLSHYMLGGHYIVLMLPLTIILLALPLYRQLPLLMEHKLAIVAGILAGVFTSVFSVISLCLLLDVDENLIHSLIPKSITTPLGLLLSKTLGGVSSVTVLSIVISGVMGVIIYIPVFKIFKIKHPIAQGIAFGTASHALGTSKAMELGEVTGAMSGLAIVLAGVTTVAAAPLYLIIFFYM